MKKGLTTLLVVLLAIGAMLVSCKAEIGTPADELVSASFELGSSRALSATLEQFNPENYYWKYAAKKNVADTSGLNSGATNPYSEAGALWVKTGTQGPVKGLAGYKVPDFSQGLWDFMLFAYKDADGDELIYQGEATAATLVKGGENLVHVVVSPAPIGNGILFIGETTLKPRDTHDSPTVSRFPKVEDLDGHEYTPTSGTTYELEAGAYKVTVTYKASGIVYAEGTVMATIYPNMTTTVTGSVDELVTYAQFEAEQNPDIIARTAEATGIKVNQIVETGSYTLEDTAKSETVAAVVTATVPKEAAWALITDATSDPSATMSLALNVDTVDSTSTSVTYEIGMTKTVTVNSQSTTSDVTHVEAFVSVEIALRTGLTGVAVKHGTTDMTPSADKDAYDASTVETFFYDSTAGKLYIKTQSFSPFAVTYDGQTAGVAEVNGVKYATLKAAVEAAKSGDTVKLLSDAEGAGMSINKSLTIDFQNHTYTGVGPGAGSQGTETQLFQLLGGEILFKNGTLTSVSGSGIKMLVNNYSDLTLDGMTLDGRFLDDSNVMYYTLSHNKGDVVITGKTNLIAHADNGSVTGKAFDVWGKYNSGKEDRTITFDEDFTGKVEGVIEYTAAPEGKKAQLIIKAGDFTEAKLTVSGTLTEDSFIEISGGTFGFDPTAYVPEGYKVEEIEGGKYKVVAGPDIQVVTGTEEPVYMTFLEFAESVNDGDDYSESVVTLLKDVDLSDVAVFTPIGTSEHPFNGTFDGGNKTISNLTISAPGSIGALFGVVDSGTTIRNLTLSEVSISGKYVAGFVGDAETADDLILQNLNCLSGEITATNYAAGIAFDVEGANTLIEDCSNSVDVTSDFSASGIVAWHANGTIAGCLNNGDLIGGNRAGGIAGNADSSDISYCINNGDITVTGGMPAGGIVGVTPKTTSVCYCINYGDVTNSNTSQNANASAAGIVGQGSNSAPTIMYCINMGTITADNSYASGIAVSLYGGDGISYCYNAGSVVTSNSGKENGAFGFCGARYGTAKAAYSLNAGVASTSMTVKSPTACYYYDEDALKKSNGDDASVDVALADLNSNLSEPLWGIDSADGKIKPLVLIPEQD